jgi:YbbR domain-containing protein
MSTRINLRFVAFLLALVLWFYVNIIISPTVRRSLNAQIDFRNVPSRMKVIPKRTDAEIVLTGTRRDFIFAGKEAVQASVDLYNMRPGAAFFPLKVTTPSGLSVVAMRPAQIEVTGEPLTTRKMELSIDLKGQVAEGFIAESPMASPSEVLIEGPRDLVEKITACQVSIPINDLKNSLSESKTITVFGPQGIIEKDLRLVPDKAQVTMTVKAGYPARMVPIIPQFINKPPEGFKLENYAFTPAEVSISGPQRVLEQMVNVRTTPIDLALLTASTTLIALLDAPAYENVTISGSNTVSLKIGLGETQLNRTFTGLPIVLKNTSQQHCSVSPASYSLLIKGFPHELSKISPEELTITIDTRAMIQGSYTVPLPCPSGLPGQVEILEIIPPKATIQVAPIDPGTSTTGL